VLFLCYATAAALPRIWTQIIETLCVAKKERMNEKCRRNHFIPNSKKPFVDEQIKLIFKKCDKNHFTNFLKYFLEEIIKWSFFNGPSQFLIQRLGVKFSSFSTL